MRIILTLDRDATRREENDYVRALVEAGIEPREIELVAPGSRPNEPFDGLLLGGGSDVDPSRYGRRKLRGGGVKVDAARDETDFAFLVRALAESVPVLGICRGIQVINVAFGGTLVQDIPTERPSSVIHQRSAREKTRLDHAVAIRAGTRLRAIAGVERIEVNSRHHQAIDQLGHGVSISAEAPDGVIEAIERPEHGIVAVQWHPENLSDPVSRRLFQDFTLSVRERAGVESIRER